MTFRQSLKRGVWLGVFLRCLCMPPPLWADVTVVQAVMAQYPNRPLRPEQKGAAMVEIARRLGYGVHQDERGTFCPMPDSPITIDCNLVVSPSGAVFDVLEDEDFLAKPAWTYKGQIDPPSAFIAVSAPRPPPEPPPAPMPPLDLSSVEQQLDALAIDLARMARQLEAHEASEADFREAVRGQWKRIGGFLLKYVAPIVGGVLAGVGGS